ncbi:MAG: sigma-70 family RNA polymerase sigma factor [Deltaproteobacteria bacterium]|nr:sigma-70 family RNA polymerase sigma factor [Deltaproteobacteria bacterium]NIS76800.1 sigma-70 family RNA polymerase sigma factor [Deltaproteobacteria bacterium]
MKERVLQEDDRIIEGLKSRDEQAVMDLIDKYQGRIYNLAISILRNEGDAEEITQDVFMTVYQKIDSFKGDSAFFSWVYRICVNACLMRLRNRKRTDAVSIEDFMPVFTEEGRHASEIGDWSREVERRVLNRELGEVLRKFIAELSDKYRVVLVLSDVEGLSNEETANILGLSIPAVKSRLHRARLFLRERLDQYLKAGEL